jgi:helix-turn-helix protein
MKTRLLIITILLLFISLSSEVMAIEIPITNEVEFVIEEDKSEKETEKQELILQHSFQLPSLDLSSILPSTPFLDNYLSKDNSYKPPIF